MAVRHIVLAAFAVMLALPAAYAQPATFTGVEGTLSLTFPPGWRRLDTLFKDLKRPGVEFEADFGDAIRGEPGVACTLKMDKSELPPGASANAANTRMRATHDKLPPAEPGHVKTVTTRGPGVEIETRILKGKRDDMVIWQAMYAKGQTLYRPNMVCFGNVPKTGISVQQADTITAMIAAMKYDLK